MLTGDGPARPDPRQRTACKEVQSLFRKAVARFDCGFSCITIPFDKDTSFPGHLYLSALAQRLSNGKTPS